jgi:hypothetical protein
MGGRGGLEALPLADGEREPSDDRRRLARGQARARSTRVSTSA